MPDRLRYVVRLPQVTEHEHDTSTSTATDKVGRVARHCVRSRRVIRGDEPPRSLDDRSREQLHEALCEQDWSVSRAACALGITRRSLSGGYLPPPHVQVRQTATATLPSHFDPRDRFRLAS